MRPVSIEERGGQNAVEGGAKGNGGAVTVASYRGVVSGASSRRGGGDAGFAANVYRSAFRGIRSGEVAMGAGAADVTAASSSATARADQAERSGYSGSRVNRSVLTASRRAVGSASAARCGSRQASLYVSIA